MPVSEGPIPDEVRKSFLNELKGDIGKNAPFLALPVFVLGLRDLEKGGLASHARRVGWQVLTIDQAGATISGDLPDQQRGGAPRIASRLQGPLIEKVWWAYNEAKKQKVLDLNAYEPRVLRIPGLHIEAFWLRHKPDQPKLDQLDLDFVVAFHTFDQKLSQEPILSMREFQGAVKLLAIQKLGAGIPRD